MALGIDYESEGFAVGAPVANGAGTFDTSWSELLWAALTVGRPNRQYIFRHGMASMYEALFRLSLVRMALEQSGPMGNRLRRTAAARTLDPTEKGAVNYFLGLAICKLFAARLLNAPWLLHLDVFRPILNPVLSGRSRPDLVGQTVSGAWVALECKGRMSVPDTTAKYKAKEQARRLVRINGAVPAFHIGGIAYFKNEVLRFYWCDPEPEPHTIKRPVEVTVRGDAWQHYYTPVLDLIRSRQDYVERMQRESVLMPIEDADVEVGIHPTVLRRLISSSWEDARRTDVHTGTDAQSPYQSDGMAVVAGKSWLLRFDER